MNRISATICLLLLGVLGASAINLPTNQQDFILLPETSYLLYNCQGTELKPFYDGDVLSHVEMNKNPDEDSCIYVQLNAGTEQDRQLDDVWTIECGLTLVYIGHNAESSQVVGLAYC